MKIMHLGAVMMVRMTVRMHISEHLYQPIIVVWCHVLIFLAIYL